MCTLTVPWLMPDSVGLSGCGVSDCCCNTDSMTETFDPDVLRDRYRAERDKRVRADANEQYVEMVGRYAQYLDDPYVEARERAPLFDEVQVAL